MLDIDEDMWLGCPFCGDKACADLNCTWVECDGCHAVLECGTTDEDERRKAWNRRSIACDKTKDIWSCPFCGGIPEDDHSCTNGGTDVSGVACGCGASIIGWGADPKYVYPEWNKRIG